MIIILRALILLIFAFFFYSCASPTYYNESKKERKCMVSLNKSFLTFCDFYKDDLLFKYTLESDAKVDLYDVIFQVNCASSLNKFIESYSFRQKKVHSKLSSSKQVKLFKTQSEADNCKYIGIYIIDYHI